MDYVAIEVDPLFDNVDLLFRDTLSKLGEELMPRFMDAKQFYEGALKSVIRDNRQIGLRNSLSVSLSIDPEWERKRLTDAWLGDLRALSKPLLIFLDRFERLPPAEEVWIRASLLPGVAEANMLRVVIAGRRAPEAHSSWQKVCAPIQELSGVPDAQHWMPIVMSKKRQIPVAPPEPYVALACEFFKGNPNLIFKWIEGLPLVADAVN
jgi:hypothetical protein